MELETNSDGGGRAMTGAGPPTSTRLYLARHGQTPLNAAGVLRGLLDPPLDAVGRQQAERLGAALEGRDVRLVVASPLRRAVETAEAVAARAHLEVVVDARLIDRDYGRWAGQSREAVEAQWGSLDTAPDVEAARDVWARANQALADIARRLAGQVAVAVSHDAVLRLALTALDPYLGDPDHLAQATGCFNTLDYEAGRWTVARVNEVPPAQPPAVVDADPGTHPATSPPEGGSDG